MKFQANSRRKAIEYEKDLVKKWKADKTFEKSVEQRPASNSYVFYDGPPFITGVPHHGTLLSSIVKDVVPRYWTMKGKRVERLWGWDCHGLPAEVFTEKKLGIQDRRDIGTKISLEEYITTCRDNMVQTGNLWEDTIDRIGRWVNFRGAYKTMDKNYMESVWWAFKELYDKGKIYEGERVLLYCTRDATPLSKAEVTMDAGSYQNVNDPSVYVKFKLSDAGKKHDFKVGKDTKVLFVCSANIGRSQAAMSLYNLYTNSDNGSGAGTNVEGNEYAGAHTIREFEKLRSAEDGQEVIAPTHSALLESHNIDIANNSRHQLSEAMIKDYDLVVNLASRNQTPAWFRGENVVWWDIEDVGPSGSIETARKNIREIDRRVRKLVDGDALDDGIDATYLLAWTTTPWTLPANTAVAVNQDADYAEVELEDRTHFVLAKELLEKVLTDEKHKVLPFKVLKTFKGKELVGKAYEPLFTDRGEQAHKVWHADYVTMEDGTGIVHLAPAYGEEDYNLSRENGFPFVSIIDESGFYVEGDWKGQNVWEANKPIAKELYARGNVWKIEYVVHSYPHCYRCGTRLMYRAHPSWFFNVQGQKDLMLEQNENVNWFPQHLKEGRFRKNVEQAPDWNLSRDRFWATAMPVWKGTDKDGTEHVKVVGSYAELKELSGIELDDYHRPWVDDIEFDLDGVHYQRIDKVLDCWFESGSMPFAQFHYPFENKEKFERSYPGDFIVEYIGQVRAWFYYVHTVGVGLFGTNSYKNVITTGTLAGNDGRKMSKSYGNYTDPNELMDKFSADALRFLLLSSPVLSGEDFSLQDKDVQDVQRKLAMIWNMYDFFTLYASVDDWEWDGKHEDPSDSLTNPLDKWVVSRLHQLQAHLVERMDAYDIPSALELVLPFLDDASNWYVRRSRRRFWKSGDDSDKNDAYQTLHYVLVRLSIILAPFVPFLSEELFQKLTGGEMGESVHLLDWPKNGAIDGKVLEHMATLRDAINQGLSKRAENRLKVRQPLASVQLSGTGIEFLAHEAEHASFYAHILLEELNVKQIGLHPSDEQLEIELDTEITPELKREGLMRELIRQVQAARKAADLKVDDRIMLVISSEDDEVQLTLKEHAKTITSETLAKSLNESSPEQYKAEVTVDGFAVNIALAKA